MRLEGAVRIGVNADCCLLTWAHVGQAGFAEIGLDPDAPAGQLRKHRGARFDEIPDLQFVNPCHDAVIGRDDRRIGEIEPRLVELGLRCSDRRVALDRDIRIAVQRDYGAGDLLFDRCNVLTGDLEVRFGLLIDRARSPTGGDERLLAGILTLVEIRGIPGRLQLRQLLAVGRLERTDLQACKNEPRLGLGDGDLVRPRIDPKQQLALADVLIVCNGDFDHLAGNSGIDRLLRRAHKCVVRRDVRLLHQIVRRAECSQQDREQHQQRPAQPLSQCPFPHRIRMIAPLVRPGARIDKLRRIVLVDRDAGRHRVVGWCQRELHGGPHGH